VRWGGWGAEGGGVLGPGVALTARGGSERISPPLSAGMSTQLVDVFLYPPPLLPFPLPHSLP
jgi:hypothetical protein